MQKDKLAFQTLSLALRHRSPCSRALRQVINSNETADNLRQSTRRACLYQHIEAVDCNLMGSFICSNIVDVSMGEKTNGWARHTTENLGEAVLGRFCDSNQSVLI